MEVQQRKEVYVFESENTDMSPVDIIIKGRNITNGTVGEELYYKVQIFDQERGLLPIRRNHHYRLEIVGNLYNGSASFAEAVEGAPANNIWLSISDEVRTVTDDKFKLTVDEFQVVRNANEVAANNILNLGFNLESLGAQPVDVTKVKAAWVDESQNVADPMFETTYDPATGQGNIKLTLNAALADQVAEGAIIVSYGQLFRRITVKVTPEFEFTPVWASTEGKQGQHDHVTLVFNIPDNYPAELFPFDVLITTNELDANAHTGQKLTVVTVGEYGYGEKFTDIIDGKEVSHVGYKYVYKAAGPGMHRIYFQTLENQVLDGFDTYITIEAENFRRHNQHVVLSNVNYESYLTAENKYLFVPQKINAPVNLNFSALNDVLTNGESVAAPVAITSENTFHLHTDNLAYTNDGAVSYTPINEENWGTEGRVIEFHSLNGVADGKMSLNLRTLTPYSAEALYVASGDAETEFRSITFELLNYPEFGFNASVNGSTKELELSYDPDQEIEVSFDVTSFTATDGNDVDPFGTAFDIYIDAPTLILGNNPALSGKVEDLGNGRFVYHVDADRAVEATYGTGERKTIVFKPKAIATVGEITISSDQSKVIYLSQTIAIKNRAIVGTIKCGASEIAGHAVSFHRKSDNARIFSTTVREDGKYEFLVINEKISDWENEPIIVFAQKEGDYYTAEIPNLKALFTSPDIILNL
jgi:hypothetical protein